MNAHEQQTYLEAYRARMLDDLHRLAKHIATGADVKMTCDPPRGVYELRGPNERTLTFTVPDAYAFDRVIVEPGWRPGP